MSEQQTDPRYGMPFTARKAAVASPNELASMVGYNILQKGGNAVDAMVAVNAALSVVFPHMTGPGGDAFWIFYDAEKQKYYTLNASGRAAENVSESIYKEKQEVDKRGPLSAITVPGAVDGWDKAHGRFGDLSFAECLQEAIDLAREGFPVSKSLARFQEKSLHLLRKNKRTAKTFLKRGIAPYLENDWMKNEALAKSLEMISQRGRKAFYEGDLAKEMVEDLEKMGGILTTNDFKQFESTWATPLEIDYRGKKVIAPPPNSEGMATLQILGMLENFSQKELAEDEAKFIDLFTRATYLSFIDRDEYVDDPKFNAAPLEELLSKQYLKERAQKLEDSEMIQPESGIGALGDTTFSCAVDELGNVCGVIQSLYWEWGSGVVAGDTGILLQNRGSFFTLDDNENENHLYAARRPVHTLTCSLVFDEEGRPELVVGAMGGEGQPQTQATIISRVLDQNYSIQEAIDAPRFLLGRTWGDKFRGLRLEGRYKTSIKAKLEELGHERVKFIEDFSDLVGHAQAIHLREDRIEAAADPRAGGLAIGY